MGHMFKYSLLLILVLFISACSSTQPSYKYVNTANSSVKPQTQVNKDPATRYPRPTVKKPILNQIILYTKYAKAILFPLFLEDPALQFNKFSVTTILKVPAWKLAKDFIFLVSTSFQAKLTLPPMSFLFLKTFLLYDVLNGLSTRSKEMSLLWEKSLKLPSTIQMMVQN